MLENGRFDGRNVAKIVYINLLSLIIKIFRKIKETKFIGEIFGLKMIRLLSKRIFKFKFFMLIINLFISLNSCTENSDETQTEEQFQLGITEIQIAYFHAKYHRGTKWDECRNSFQFFRLFWIVNDRLSAWLFSNATHSVSQRHLTKKYVFITFWYI